MHHAKENLVYTYMYIYNVVGLRYYLVVVHNVEYIIIIIIYLFCNINKSMYSFERCVY